mmetsp:Transcript_9355/g.27940  ORF Transcript_9355/g.27940 Transcript_9355/m.27940 type:complete len:83 (-) Transcript_9355:2268-2516(-)
MRWHSMACNVMRCPHVMMAACDCMRWHVMACDDMRCHARPSWIILVAWAMPYSALLSWENLSNKSGNGCMVLLPSTDSGLKE